MSRFYGRCIAYKDTLGADLHPRLNRMDLAAVVRKGEQRHIDSYSTFNNGRRAQTALDGWLRTHDIDRLTVLGWPRIFV